MTMPVGFRENKENLATEAVLMMTYPEKEGFDRRLYRGTRGRSVCCHVGYRSERMARCECGAEPVLEQTVDDATKDGRNVPAQRYVAICPRCETRTEYDGEIEKCIEEWNAGRFTEDSMMLKHAIRSPNLEGYARLAGKVIGIAYDDAVVLLKEKQRLRKKMQNPLIGSATMESCRTQIDSINGELRALQFFFENSPLMMNRDPESIISDIRKEVYPMVRPEVRMQKPLVLSKM